MLKGLGACAPFAPMVPTPLYYQVMVVSRKVSYAESLPIVNLRLLNIVIRVCSTVLYLAIPHTSINMHEYVHLVLIAQ